MRVYFFSRRQIITAALALLFTAAATGGVSVFASKGSSDPTQSQVFYQGNSGQKVVALDVNVDWGEDQVPGMLAILDQEKVPVTFFVTGTWAKKHPDLLKEMVRHGHAVESHGFRHLHLSQASEDIINKEMENAEEVIMNATGKKPTLFAPPYGELDNRVTRIAVSRGYRVIMWSLDTIDWQRPSPETIANRIVKRLHNDAIVLMHPTEPTIKALPGLIKELKARGYQIKKVKDIISVPAGEGISGPLAA